jgi:hypothetical protein
MKYFTSEWWASDDEAFQNAVIEQYHKYFESVRHQVPAEYLDLSTNYTLHDSEVKKITVHPLEGSVHIKLHGFDANLENRLIYNLVFSGVRRFDQTFPQADYVEQELGDLGYWEIEVISHGFELRMLFVTGAEFQIVFERLSFTTSEPA